MSRPILSHRCRRICRAGSRPSFGHTAYRILEQASRKRTYAARAALFPWMSHRTSFSSCSQAAAVSRKDGVFSVSASLEVCWAIRGGLPAVRGGRRSGEVGGQGRSEDVGGQGRLEVWGGLLGGQGRSAVSRQGKSAGHQGRSEVCGGLRMIC